jgi:hypothetical protein
MTVDNIGNLIMIDNKRIRKLTLNKGTVPPPLPNVVNRYGGSFGSYVFNQYISNNTQTLFNWQIDADSQIYITQENSGNYYVSVTSKNCIYKIFKNDITVSLFAGTPGANDQTPQNGPLDTATFKSISQICLDLSGNLYVNDFGLIRKIDTDRNVTTIISTINIPSNMCVDSNNYLSVRSLSPCI